ncbi:MAG TPA: methyltransferase domain-containing protein [Clostridiaceae bacterium]|nr:methyltransferase domain-containing protein [Clostridiaceae bacterium]
MSLKESNEITLKIKCELNEFYKIIEEKGFKIIDEFSMDDTYFVPKEVDLDKTDIRDTLSKALLVRDIIGKMSNKRTKLITFKIKNFDEAGNILNQESINCNILEIEDAKKLLKVIGYKEIMNIKENDVVYEKDGFQLAVKNIKDGDNLIEIETEENDEIDTIEKLIQKVNKMGIPVYTDDYFVKKAEIELEKILREKTNKNIEKYYDNTENEMPNYTVKKFIELNVEPGNAVELGCGAGRDTVYLIKNGWNVLAIDREDVETRIVSKLLVEELEQFEFFKQRFEAIKLENSNLVVANFSLPFCNKNDFKKLWDKINQSILNDGYFVGNFFGDKDEWKIAKEEMTFLTKDQVMELFRDFEIVEFKEVEKDGLTGLGKMKHWHIFNVIAKKK